MSPKGRNIHILSILRIAAVVLFVVSFSSPRPCSGQSLEAQSGAQSLLIDPSVRASGMGKTGNAVFWGDSPNYWSNPALLGSRKGVVYEWGKTQLVPDLADDIFFTTKRVTAGVWGLGVLIAGRPFSNVGGLKLNYGVSVATDENGNIVGTFTSYEDIQTFAGGANLLEFAEHALAAGGVSIPLLSRFGDVSVGWSDKKTHVFLAPADATLDRQAGEGYVTTHDSGVLVRLTPYNSIDYAGSVQGIDRLAGLRVDFSYGGSTQNYNNAIISYVDPSQADPIARIQNKGWATHVALDVPSSVHNRANSSWHGWLLGCVTPVLSVGIAGDREIPMIRDATTGAHRRGSRVQHSGWELTIANIYSVRRGHIDDPAGTIQDDTSGWGIGLHVKDMLGFSYDRANIPQSKFLGRVNRKAFSFYFNPIRAWSALHPGHRGTI